MQSEIREFNSIVGRKPDKLYGRNGYPVFEIWPWDRYHFCSLHMLLAFGRSIFKALVHRCFTNSRGRDELKFLEELEDLEYEFPDLNDMPWDIEKERIRVFCNSFEISFDSGEKTVEHIYSHEARVVRKMNETRRKESEERYIIFENLQSNLRKRGFNVKLSDVFTRRSLCLTGEHVMRLLENIDEVGQIVRLCPEELQSLKNIFTILRVSLQKSPTQDECRAFIDNVEDYVDDFLCRFELKPFYYCHIVVVHMRHEMKLNSSLGYWNCSAIERIGKVLSTIIKRNTNKKENQGTHYLMQAIRKYELRLNARKLLYL